MKRGGENQAGSSGGKGHTGRADKGSSLLALPIPYPKPAESQQAHKSPREIAPKYDSIPLTVPISPALKIS